MSGKAVRTGTGRAVWTVALPLALLIGCSGFDAATSLWSAGEPSAAPPDETRPAALERWYAVAVPVPEAAQLIGLEPPALRQLLGPPDFQRREAPAEIWRYDFQPCTLDLFLHQTLASGPYKVAHAQFRPGGPGDRQCRLPALAVRAEATPDEHGLPPVESH
jgi:hypothetical protein